MLHQTQAGNSLNAIWSSAAWLTVTFISMISWRGGRLGDPAVANADSSFFQVARFEQEEDGTLNSIYIWNEAENCHEIWIMKSSLIYFSDKSFLWMPALTIWKFHAWFYVIIIVRRWKPQSQTKLGKQFCEQKYDVIEFCSRNFLYTRRIKIGQYLLGRNCSKISFCILHNKKISGVKSDNS